MSTRCSTARGPAGSPSLVTWPTTRSGTPVDLARRVRRSTHARTCATLPAGWASVGVGDRLERVDDDQRGALAVRGRLDRLEVGPLERQQVRRHPSEPSGPAAHLGQRLLGRGEQHLGSGGGEGREHLEEEGRLADARGTEEQRHRAGDHAATEAPGRARRRRSGAGAPLRSTPRTTPPVPSAAPGPQPTAPGALGGAGANVFHSPQLGQRPTQRSEVDAQAAQRKEHVGRGAWRCEGGHAGTVRRGVTIGSVPGSSAVSALAVRGAEAGRGGRRSVRAVPVFAVVQASPGGRPGDEEVGIVRGSWAAASARGAHRARGRRRWRGGGPRARRAGPAGRAARRGGRRRPCLRRHRPTRAAASARPSCATLLSAAEDRQWPLLVLLGDPAYYGRFGFEPAGPLGLGYAPAGADSPHFMARRLDGDGASLPGDVHLLLGAAG